MTTYHFNTSKHLLFSFILWINVSYTWTQNSFVPHFISATYDDQYTSWSILDMDEEIIGTINCFPGMNNDLTQWSFEIGDQNGTIRQKWRDNPNTWELFGDNKRFTANTVFPNQPGSWTIEGPPIRNFQLDLQIRFPLITWRGRGSSSNNIFIQNFHEGDLRDWITEINPEAQIDNLLYVLVSFIAIYHSIQSL